MSFRFGENETGIDVVLIKKNTGICAKCKGNP